jgi:hypothetical protein
MRKPVFFLAAVPFVMAAVLILGGVGITPVYADTPVSAISGTWRYELLGSHWGAWEFTGNQYKQWMLDWEENGKPKDPDETGTFTIQGSDIVLKPAVVWGVDVTSTSTPKVYHFTLKGNELSLWEEGKKPTAYVKAAGGAAPVPSMPSITGTWRYELLGSPWGAWEFTGNQYKQWMLDWEENGKPKDPDETGTFTIQGSDIVLKPAVVWGVDVTSTSKPKVYHFTLKGNELSLWEEGKKPTAYIKTGASPAPAGPRQPRR